MSISRKLKNAASGSADGGGSAGGYVDDVFSTFLYEGTAASMSVNNGIDLSGEGGLVWIKNRSTSADHSLGDTARGVSAPVLSSNSPSQGTDYGAYGFTGFNSDGFTINGAGSAGLDTSGNDYVSWTFRKAPSFFDIVTYTGNGVAGREIPHNLGVEPGTIFIKRLDTSNDWIVYHRSTGNSAYLRLNKTNAVSSSTDIWGATGPTSSKFTLGSGGSTSNAADGTYVAYLFAHDDSDESMIKCGSYTGNGVTNEIDLGWEPQFVLIKSATTAKDWNMFDTMRGIPTGGADAILMANESAAESVSSNSVNSHINLLPNGFQLANNSSQTNDPSQDFIYMAIRRPNKPAEEFEPEELFAVDTMGSTGDSKPPAFRSEFPVDMAIRSDTGGASHEVASRLTQGNWLYSDKTDPEKATTDYADFDFSNGWSNTGTTASNYVSHMWRRAPGFFDVVAYEGNGVAGREVKHNLSVPPEMIWLKTRTFNDGWVVWNKYLSDPLTKYLSLNNDFQESNQSSTPQFGGAMPTDSFFKVGTDPGSNNASSTYIAYLFASVPGISKVGSYTGNGGNQTIDCGFTNGARTVIIKRTDSAGDWYLCGIDGWLDWTIKLNTTDPKDTNTANPTSDPSGFRLSSAGGSNVNISGAEYIYYAIA
jgi:hypothetical protein